MKKGDIPGSRMYVLAGVAIIAVIFFIIGSTALTPSLKSSDEARASYFAHTLASYISALSSVDEGFIERDFEEQCDVEIEKYTWVGTLTHLRKRPSYYYVKVTVYKKGDKKRTKIFFDDDPKKACDVYCKQYNCECESCSKNGECKIADLEKSVTSEAVPFIGFVDIGPGQKSFNIAHVRYLSLQKDPSEDAVKILKTEGVYFCTEPTENEVKDVIERYGQKYNVDSIIIRSVITGESAFGHCDAEGNVKTSFTGESYGIMQLLPSTANWIAQQNNENIDYKNSLDNIKAGTMYLNYTRGRMVDYTQGEDLDKVMVANYNCEKIHQLVKDNCVKGQPGCWDKVEKYINSGDPGTKEKFCQGKKGDETYKYVRKIFNEIKPCFEGNPDCYYSCFSPHLKCSERDWEAVVR